MRQRRSPHQMPGIHRSRAHGRVQFTVGAEWALQQSVLSRTTVSVRDRTHGHRSARRCTSARTASAPGAPSPAAWPGAARLPRRRGPPGRSREHGRRGRRARPSTSARRPVPAAATLGRRRVPGVAPGTATGSPGRARRAGRAAWCTWTSKRSDGFLTAVAGVSRSRIGAGQGRGTGEIGGRSAATRTCTARTGPPAVRVGAVPAPRRSMPGRSGQGRRAAGRSCGGPGSRGSSPLRCTGCRRRA